MTPTQLNQMIQALHDPLRTACLRGDCDAFALALHGWLREQGVDAALRVGHRRMYDGPHLVEENPLSHVVVHALGMTWDAAGADAPQRWEAQWAAHDLDHRFTWSATDAEGLRALRQLRDQRDVRPERLEQCRHHLQQAWDAVLLAEPTALGPGGTSRRRAVVARRAAR